jgi:hypothetical protein
MTKLFYNCRLEKKLTVQIIKVVTDTLPPNVHVLMCTSCGQLCVSRVDIETAIHADI